MSLVTFSEVSRFYGRQDVLSSVTLSVEPGEHIGLVGRNGAGKTTLIRLILGEEQPDSGLVTRARGLKIGWLPQEIAAAPDATLLDTVLDTDPEFRRVEAQLREVEEKLSLAGAKDSPFSEGEVSELAERQGRLLHDFERLGGWEKEPAARKILSGLGFAESDCGRGLREFSGGWVMRALLARLLLAKPDLMILDEPTNHLDLDSLIWLEGWLKSAPSALILVSHDRVFLNNICRKIIELRQGRASVYQGNYDSYVEQKALRILTESNAFDNQQGQIRLLEQFIDRNKVRASTARRAQSRVKTLENMERLEKPETDDDFKFKMRLPVGRRGPDLVLELQNVKKSFGQTEVFSDLSLILKRGARIALVGPNGRGKSTLIRLAAGITPPDGGVVRTGSSTDIGYFAQFQMDSLTPELTVIEEFARSAGALTPGKQRSVLGSFLFSGEDVFKKVRVLSGGEKTRLVLAKIMMEAPNLLLLDEPTNHLDIAGRRMLEEALADYQGTMILISHDRHFINKLADSVGVIENGGLSVYPGNYDDYRDIWLKRAQEDSGAKEGGAREAGPKEPPPARAEKNRGEKRAEKGPDPLKKERDKARRKIQKGIDGTEEALAALSLRQKEVEAALSLPETYQDQSLVKELVGRSQALKKEEAELEAVYERQLTDLEELG
jgi:ATP-binding cassette subfamily F protein 3